MPPQPRKNAGGITPQSESDESLMALIWAGDAEAFQAFYTRHKRLALAVARRVLRDRERAEDATQEAFLALWRRASTYEPARGSARSWAMRIVMNSAIDKLRRQRADEFRGVPAEGRAAGHGGAFEEGADAPLIRKQIRSRLTEMLDQLPPEQHQAIELKYFEGYSVKEISSMLGVPEGTVKGRLRLGMDKLRRQVGDAADDLQL